MESTTIRLILVEDFPPFLKLVRSILSKNPDLQIIGEVSDGREAVRQAEELKPDLILLDISLPTLNGIAVARQIRDLVPQSKIIFVTTDSSPSVVEEAFNAGARGYVLKTRLASDLLAAVYAVLQGEQFVSDGLPPPHSH